MIFLMLHNLRAKKVLDCNYEELENIFEMKIMYRNINCSVYPFSSLNLTNCYVERLSFKENCCFLVRLVILTI